MLRAMAGGASVWCLLLSGWGASAEETGPLAKELGEKTALFTKMAPAEIIKLYADGIEKVDGTGITKSAKQAGDTAPGFVLPNARGEDVQLAQLLKQGPVVVVWYRGGWCPYCNIALRAYQQALPQFQEHGATLVAISPELPDHSLTTKQKSSLKFQVLSDVGNQVAEKYGVVFRLPEDVAAAYNSKFDLAKHNGDDSYTLPLAATYVINQDGEITYAFLDADYRKRAEPSDVLDAVKKLTGQ